MRICCDEQKMIGKRTHCLLCGQDLSEEPLLSLDGMPASAQDIPDIDTVSSDKGIALRLYQCGVCGLVQFDCTPVAYYRDVIRAGGTTSTMKQLRGRQYQYLIETHHLQGKKIIEVGCGGGEFLSMLEEFPVLPFGAENREKLVETAQGKGLSVTWGFADGPDTILGTDSPYDAFLSFNFLEHQPEPGKMLDCIWNNLSDQGVGLITVPSLEYILEYNGYYELIRDHIAYYSFETLRFLCTQHGFEVLEEELVNRDTCSVIVKKSKSRGRNNQIPSVEKTDIGSLTTGMQVIRDELGALKKWLVREGKRLAIWGGSHQGFTLAATTCLKDMAQYVIDSAPFKQGKFTPASHLPIVAPDHYFSNPVDAILIVAPGYTDEIAQIVRSSYKDTVLLMTVRGSHLEVL